MSLKDKTINGVFWALSQQFSIQLINFIVQIVLARLLLPEHFGLIAMIQIFITMGQALMDSGMSSSLIRNKQADQEDYSTVFYMNILTSIVIYFVLFFVSPSIATFFDQPELTIIVRVMTLTFIIQAFVGVQSAVLTREVNFKLQAIMQLPSSILGGIVGIVTAYLGYGVWSLVFFRLTTSFVFMIQHWYRTNWRPGLYFNTKKLKEHFNFGFKLTLSSLIASIYSNSYAIIIGKLFPANLLGFYNQADTLRMFPVRNLTSALQRVTFPIFSSIQDDNQRLKSTFKKITSVVFFLVVPIMLLLIILATPLFRQILTDKWLPAVPYFQILCFSAIAYPLSVYNLNILLVKGKSNLHLKLEIVKKIFAVIFLLLIIPFGFLGAVYARAIGMFVQAFFNIHYSGKIIDYSFKEQMMDLLPTLCIGILAMVGTYLINYSLAGFLDLGDWLFIIFSSMFYVVFYVGFSYLFKLQSLKDMQLLIKDILQKSRFRG
ncbi:lipopolysaccharide biosynthesis protein [Robiginitalea marina]|uniref:Lipopolysaccharide biosynthesis protein n=1 Tax=Robiginitalea marina TaxID=2954105 RepID=A0ABT1AUP8_9FLAO|nr:lipopolysaccharide biosynthesis protein [Robiginitalea marina]MCO5723330.1 lipopolysaccharide biosynthesis protein [Robiginitalea marina]